MKTNQRFQYPFGTTVQSFIIHYPVGSLCGINFTPNKTPQNISKLPFFVLESLNNNVVKQKQASDYLKSVHLMCQSRNIEVLWD